jgi:hypothetical protein
MYQTQAQSANATIYMWHPQINAGAVVGTYVATTTTGNTTTLLTTGSRVGLRAGSSWYEEVVMPAASETWASYGAGARPIISGMTAIPAALWSKTGGLTNVYQAVVQVNTAGQWIGFREAGTRLTRKGTSTLVDGTAGSYAVSGSSTTADLGGFVTIYVYPTAGGSPGSNGLTYQYTQRGTGVTMSASSALIGIETIDQLSLAGSLTLGTGATAINCAALSGNKHNVYMGANSVINGGTFSDAAYGYNNDQGKYLIVWNGNGTGAETFAILNATITGNGPTDGNGGIEGHSNNGASFASVLVQNVTISNIQTALGLANVLTYVARNVTAITNVTNGIGDGSVTSMLIDACDIETGARAIDHYVGGSLTIQNSTIRAATDLPVRFVGTAATVTVSGSTITSIAGNAFSSFGATGMTYNVTHTVLTMPSNPYNLGTSPAASTFDYNTYNCVGWPVTNAWWPGSLAWAAWQSSAQDTHSTAAQI